MELTGKLLYGRVSGANGLHVYSYADNTLLITIPPHPYLMDLANNNLRSTVTDDVLNSVPDLRSIKKIVLSLGIFESPLDEPRYLNFIGDISWLKEATSLEELVLIVPKPISQDNIPERNRPAMESNIQGIPCSVIDLDLVMIFAYMNTQVSYPPADLSLNRAAYLVGKTRPWRLALLHELLENNIPMLHVLSTDNQYQIFFENNYDWYAEFIGLISSWKPLPEDIAVFIEQNQHTIPESSEFLNTNTYPGCWYSNAHNLTSIDIVPETQFYISFLSEKTWRSIFLGRPFVSLSHNDDVYRELEWYGFKTYLEYTSIPLGQMLDNIVKDTVTRVQDLLAALQDPTTQKKIKADIAYNQQHVQTICNRFVDEMVERVPEFAGITIAEIAEILYYDQMR